MIEPFPLANTMTPTTDLPKEKNSPAMKPTTDHLRTLLKGIMQAELETLPETLKQIPPHERVNIICKLMPYVFPKVEQVHPREGEPFTFD
jgi:hypothetical protein